MSASAVSRRYARALVELGTEQKKLDQYGQELAQVAAAFAREKQFRQFMESPSFSLEKKEAALSGVAEGMGLSTTVRNFLGLLLEKDRLRFLSQIEDRYRELADERAGILRARVTSAVDLQDAQREAIRKALEEATGKTIELTVAENPELIGGIQAEFGGRMFDGSVRSQLKRMEESLTKG